MISKIFGNVGKKTQAAILAATMAFSGANTTMADDIGNENLQLVSAKKDYLANGYAGSPYGKSTSYSETGSGVGMAVFLGKDVTYSEEAMRDFFEKEFAKMATPANAFVVRDQSAEYTYLSYSFKGLRSDKTYHMWNFSEGIEKYALEYTAHRAEKLGLISPDLAAN